MYECGVEQHALKSIVENGFVSDLYSEAYLVDPGYCASTYVIQSDTKHSVHPRSVRNSAVIGIMLDIQTLRKKTPQICILSKIF